ncbi:MOSC domain-containing protein [Nocardioides sp. CFH 31398]|uniref:MOSC domain-containing protein n=1 Tax=Nocardioides sp. CFH 31398 TaxID=2919579 RepID=UPI001F06A303|nr:MOSC domain-containing protein [Nocardioides sp. CFH 31398]MCH1865894.1 MOSC domain-containing protein [Nocardioides sp. CFH 31398]
MEPRVLAVTVLGEVRAGHRGPSGIDKRPVTGPVAVTADGLEGDRRMGRSHRGADTAVHAYAEEDAAHWVDRLGRHVEAGGFGENLRTEGLDVCGAEIGERWRIGELLLEVRLPRTPCENLSLRLGVEGFHRDFRASGRVGAMLRVLEPGTVAAGDAVVVEHRPGHGVGVTELNGRLDADRATCLLDSGVPLARRVRERARRAVRRGSSR